MGAGCEVSEFGCCYDGETEASGPDSQGCPCSITEFGCCPDGVSICKWTILKILSYIITYKEVAILIYIFYPLVYISVRLILHSNLNYILYLSIHQSYQYSK